MCHAEWFLSRSLDGMSFLEVSVIPIVMVISVTKLTLKITVISCVAVWGNGLVARLFRSLLNENTLFNIPLTSDSSIKSLLVHCQL